MQKAAVIFEQRREEFIRIEMSETTSSIGMANLDLSLTVDG